MDALVNLKPQYKYRAFISCSSTDLAFCRKLMERLESYRLPKNLDPKHLSEDRIGKLFLYTAESEAAASLTEKLERSLRESEHLIVVCSKSAKMSDWVNLEINAFRQLNPQGSILCIVAPGHAKALMAEVFPPSLLNNQAESKFFPLKDQPLAAYVDLLGLRDSTLRLIAGLLKIDYDQLVQREAARRRKKLIASSTLASLVLAAILYSSYESINSTRNSSIGESQLLALQTNIALKEGRSSLAARLAIKGLGLSTFDNPRPYTWQSSVAISETLPALREINRVIFPGDALLAYAPRGQKGDDFVTVTEAGTINVMNGDSISKSESLPTNGKKIVAAFYSSATDSVIAGDEIGMVYRWSAENGDVLSKKLVAKVDCLTFVGKGETFSLTTMGGVEVVAVSAKDLSILDRFRIPASLDVTCSAIDVERKRAAITGADKNGDYNRTLVYVVTNSEEKKLGEVQGLAYFMTLSSDGENVLLGSVDGELGLFNIETGAEKKFVMDRKDMATSVAMSPDNKVIAAGDGKGIVHVWDVESGELKFEIGDDNDNISSLAFGDEGKNIYSASRTGKGIGYLINGKYDPVVLRGKEFDSDSIFTSGNGDLLALTSSRGSMEIWDVSKYPPVFLNQFSSDQYTEGNPDIVRAVAFGANHDSVLFSVDPGQLILWRFLDDKPAQLVEKNEKWAKAIRAIDEGHFLLAYDDGSFLQVDSNGKKTLLNFGLSSVGSFEFVSRKNAIFVSDSQGDAVLIDLKTGKSSANYKEAGRKYGVSKGSNLKLSADQTTAWVVGNDNIIRGWTLDNRKLFAKIEASKNLHGETLRLTDGYVGFVDTATGYIYDIGSRRKFDLIDPMGIAVLDFMKDSRGSIDVVSMSKRGDIRQWENGSDKPYSYRSLGKYFGDSAVFSEIESIEKNNMLCAVIGNGATCFRPFPKAADMLTEIKTILPKQSQNLTKADLQSFYLPIDSIGEKDNTVALTTALLLEKLGIN